MAFWKKKKEEEDKEETKEEDQDEDKGKHRVTGIMQFGADYRDKLPEETPSDEQLKKMYSQDLLKYYTQPEKKENQEYTPSQNEQTQYSNQYGEQYGTAHMPQSRPKSRKPPRIASATRVEKMESDHIQAIPERKLEEVPITPENTQPQTTQPKEEQTVKEPKEKEKKHGAKKPLIVRPPGRAPKSEDRADTNATVTPVSSEETKKDAVEKVEEKKSETVAETKDGLDKSKLESMDSEKDIKTLEEKYLGKKTAVEEKVKEKGVAKSEPADDNVQKKLAEVMEKMRALKKYMDELKSKGIDVTQAEKLMLLAESFLNTGNLEKAENYINKSRRAGEDLEVRFNMMQS